MRLFLLACVILFASCTKAISDKDVILSNYTLKPTLCARSTDGQKAFSVRLVEEEEAAARLKIPLCNLKETMRQMSLKACLLSASGFEPGESYNFYLDNGNSCGALADKATVTDEGKLFLERRQAYMDECVHLLDCKTPSEPFRFTLISCKTKECLTLALVPNPISCKWADGAFVEMMVHSPDCKLVTFYGEGFNPFERVEAIYSNCEDVVSKAIQADDKGAITWCYFPHLNSYNGGKVVLRLKREDFSEEQIHFNWNTAR